VKIMDEFDPHIITQRELRNDSAAVLRGVERGEAYTVTRNGTPIGRLVPLRRRIAVPREEVLAAFRSAPQVSPEEFREPPVDLAELNRFGGE
jgi:prevent-host-death family protein